MGKKKPFIDKKNASTYHILYRSQRDVADDSTDGNGGVVLWPSPDNNRETDQKVLLGKNEAIQLKDETLSTWKATLSEAGLVDDFDYDKHMKPISGTGQYLSNTSASVSKKQVGAMLDARNLSIQDDIVKEVDRQLDSIALTSDCMDEEIAQALFGDFDEGDFEELNDEFVLDAAQEPEEDDADGAFDFSAHIKNLMDKAKLESQGDGTGRMATIHELGRRDHAFFSKAKPIGKGIRGDDSDEGSSCYYENCFDLEIQGTPGIVPKLTAEEEQALCDKFNATLAEYDSDDLGEGNDDDVHGNLALEGDTQVEAALDDFLQEKEDDIFIQGTRHYKDEQRKGGSGFSVLVGTKMVPAKDIVECEQANDGGIRPISDILGEADDTLGNPYQAPPAEEIFIDGKSYFSERIRNPWDCESILSTYSNLDNNPVTIGVGSGRSRRRKNKKDATVDNSPAATEDEGTTVQQILLSEKTGLPLGVLSSHREMDDDLADTYMSVNKGEARRKNESAEEKKLRKLNVKKERQLARMQKKLMKKAFTDEFTKRQQEVMVDDVGGKSVFRF
ncbi:low temperature viability protein [Nitzschia inconspicua]|uniref:Low temperature viability protein n=1 Tax=Nitzschia inconspicua TaxID=303405 RepID=A0A9K3KVI3_9STRA|nr:low temperature viability protein [Nitzschia inconspicua]